MYGVQFRGTLQPNQSQRWFTYNLAGQQRRVLDGTSDHRPGGFAARRF
jgi:hypothetical protein